MVTARMKIEGTANLLQDAYPKPGTIKKKYSNETEKEAATLASKAYVDEIGVYMPTDCIRMMLIGNQKRPGAAKILGSMIEKGKGTKYVNACKAGVWVVGIEKKRPENDRVYFEPRRKTWDDVYETSFINASGSRSWLTRPMITMAWTLEFDIVCYADDLDGPKVRTLFEVAGMRCGCGNYGPVFGRFIVVEYEVK